MIVTQGNGAQKGMGSLAEISRQRSEFRAAKAPGTFWERYKRRGNHAEEETKKYL